MDEDMIGRLVEARARRETTPAGERPLRFTLAGGRPVTVSSLSHPAQAECIVVSGTCFGMPLAAYLPTTIMADVTEDVAGAEMLLMALVDLARENIDDFETMTGEEVIFENLTLGPCRPHPHDLRIAAGEECPDFTLRLSPALYARLKEALSGEFIAPEIEGSFGCTVFLGALDCGDEPVEAGSVLLLDRPLAAPFALIEDEIAVTLDAWDDPDGGGPTLGTIGPALDFLVAQGIVADTVLLLATRTALTVEQVYALEPGSDWPLPPAPGPARLYRRGRAIARARVIDGVSGTGLDILEAIL